MKTFAFAIAMNEFLFKNPGVNGGFAGSHVNGAKNRIVYGKRIVYGLFLVY